jgi:two-component system KDP operon response regulator KdpE
MMPSALSALSSRNELPQAPAIATPAIQRKLKVVLLDDEPSILKTWKAILEAHDFEAVCCERGHEALEAIAHGCDCVLTDYHMPDMTGIEVILAARQFTSAPIIVMTGNDSTRLCAAATASGAACVLSKPVPIKSALEMIEKLCGRRGLRA